VVEAENLDTRLLLLQQRAEVRLHEVRLVGLRVRARARARARARVGVRARARARARARVRVRVSVRVRLDEVCHVLRRP
jgi:hypothetical protein